jgi:hypothetical protein
MIVFQKYAPAGSEHMVAELIVPGANWLQE